MATKSDEAIVRIAIVVADAHNILVATVGALVKQQSGRPGEVRAEVQKALDLVNKAAANLDAMFAALHVLTER